MYKVPFIFDGVLKSAAKVQKKQAIIRFIQ